MGVKIIIYDWVVGGMDKYFGKPSPKDEGPLDVSNQKKLPPPMTNIGKNPTS